MVEGYWRELGRSLWLWSGWVFTVLGAIAGIVFAKEYWWILALIIVTFGLALGTFSYRTYRKWEEAEERHRAEVALLRAEHQTTKDRLQETERKLNEIPSNILGGLQQVIERHAFAELARLLIDYADFVGRMAQFARASPKPMNLRAFTQQAGELYALTKVESEAAKHLRQDNSFLLIRRAANGLETISARLVVHQLPEPGKDLLGFRIVESVSAEMDLLGRLAQSGDVAGIKGYRVAVACDVSRYQDQDVAKLAAVIERLVSELTPSGERYP